MKKLSEDIINNLEVFKDFFADFLGVDECDLIMHINESTVGDNYDSFASIIYKTFQASSVLTIRYNEKLKKILLTFYKTEPTNPTKYLWWETEFDSSIDSKEDLYKSLVLSVVNNNVVK